MKFKHWHAGTMLEPCLSLKHWQAHQKILFQFQSKKCSETIKTKSLLQSKKGYPGKRPQIRKRWQGIFCELHFAKISLKDHAPDLLDRISVEAALQDQFVRISLEGPGQEILCRFPSSLNMVLRVYIMAQHAFCEHEQK